MYLKHTKRSNFHILLYVTKLKRKLKLLKKKLAVKIKSLTSSGLDLNLT